MVPAERILARLRQDSRTCVAPVIVRWHDCGKTYVDVPDLLPAEGGSHEPQAKTGGHRHKCEQASRKGDFHHETGTSFVAAVGCTRPVHDELECTGAAGVPAATHR